MSLSVTAFVNRLSDAIANVTLGHGPGNFPGVGFVAGDYRQRLNVRSLKVRGVELTGDSSADHGRCGLTRATPMRASTRMGSRRRSTDWAAQTPRLAVTGSLGWARDGRSATLVIEQSARNMMTTSTGGVCGRRRRSAHSSPGRWPKASRSSAAPRICSTQRWLPVPADDGTVERATPRTLWLGSAPSNQSRSFRARHISWLLCNGHGFSANSKYS